MKKESNKGIYGQFASRFKNTEEMENFQQKARSELLEIHKKDGTTFIAFDTTPIKEASIKPDDNNRKNDKYMSMLTEPNIANLSYTNTTKQKPDVDIITGKAEIQKGSTTILIDGYDFIKGMRVSTAKLLDALTIELTKQSCNKSGNIDRQVELSLEKFMEMQGLTITESRKKESRKTVTEDLATLRSITIVSVDKEKETSLVTGICRGGGIKNGYIYCLFEDAFVDRLSKSNLITQYPTELLKIDGRYPAVYYVGKKLASHYFIRNNANRGTHNIISVESLLKSCPTIPTYDEVKARGRHFDQQIRTPLENALENLQKNGLITWEYCNSGKIPLTDDQVSSPKFSDFFKLYIKFECLDAPPPKVKDEQKRNKKKTKKQS